MTEKHHAVAPVDDNGTLAAKPRINESAEGLPS